MLLSTGNSEVPPYAFVSLRHAIFKETDSTSRRIILTSKSDGAWPTLASGEEEWLELCLLLGDGRFQTLEAPQLELRLTTDSDFNAWKTRLAEMCCEDPLLRPDKAGTNGGFHAHEAGLNKCVDELLEAVEPQKPPLLPGEETSC